MDNERQPIVYLANFDKDGLLQSHDYLTFKSYETSLSRFECRISGKRISLNIRKIDDPITKNALP